MTSLQIRFDKPIAQKQLEAVDELRNQIIPIATAVGAGEVFDWKETSSPQILYARPYKDKTRIVAITPDAADALFEVASMLKDMGQLVFGGERYKITDLSLLNDVYLPRSSQGPVYYKTVSPILLFTGNRRKLFEGILKTNGEFDTKHTPKTIEYLKTYTAELLRDDIKKKLTDYMGERNYSFVDRIDLKWEEFSLTHVPYHKDEKLTIGIKGRLVSNFYLPTFLGYKTGKGFGEIVLAGGHKNVTAA